MTRVRFLGPDTDAYVASVERHAPEFEERTGIELDVQIVPSDLYFSNRIEHLLDGDEAADVYMSGPVLLWQHLAAGFVQPLDDLLERASDTYHADDFFEPLVRCNRWTGRICWGSPVHQSGASTPLARISRSTTRPTTKVGCRLMKRRARAAGRRAAAVSTSRPPTSLTLRAIVNTGCAGRGPRRGRRSRG